MKAGYDRYSPELKQTVYNVKPGLTGIGSIVFRDEELIITHSSLPPHECYAREILPFKGALEMWYQAHRNFFTDLSILFLTGWYIVFPKSSLVNKLFPSLPKRTDPIPKSEMNPVIN